MNKEKVLGFDVLNVGYEELLDRIFKDIENKKQNFVVNINPEIIIDNYKKEDIRTIFNKQKYQIPDGSGIVWASKKNGGNIKERITGIDLMLKICEKTQNSNIRLFLYGSKKEIIEDAKKELETEYHNINIVGVCDGFCNEEDAINIISQTKPDILFIGLGSPNQEEFILKNKDKLNMVKLFLPVGGSFDVISKSKKRAPRWIINLNLEWFYRLLQEPKRIFRQTKLIKFVFLVLKNKERKSKNG